MKRLRTKSIEEEGMITLAKIKAIVKENFNEDGTLKKIGPDIVIVDYMDKIK